MVNTPSPPSSTVASEHRVSGLALSLLEHYMIEHHGIAGLRQCLNRAGLAADAPWITPVNYPASRFIGFLAASAEAIGVSSEALTRRLARWSAPRLMQRYAIVLGGYDSPELLLASLEDSVLSETSRIALTLDGLKLKLQTTGGDGIRLTLQYAQPIADAVCGLLEGLADHYACTADIAIDDASGPDTLGLSVRFIRTGSS